MVYRYLAIDETGKIYISDTRYCSKDWAFKSMDNSIYPCAVYDAVVLSNELVSIAGNNHYIDTIRVVSMDSVDTLMDEEQNEALMMKDTKHKLPDPYKDKLAPFTSAVVMACRKYEKPIALTKAEHQAKLGIVRIIKGFVGTDNEISLKKAEELLGYYGLSINSIIKDELVINN